MKGSPSEIHWGQARTSANVQAVCIYAIHLLCAVGQVIWQRGMGPCISLQPTPFMPDVDVTLQTGARSYKEVAGYAGETAALAKSDIPSKTPEL
ncbi:hypothetical protein LMG23994_06325 [Cupriavidus pinatubonensis]|uniref:Uncharacterized protein n=1 Tax=Cupriavidus pinatubonensis TaxID=248026 RepID=A0ABM8Y1T4_9BURK|nr:hypothetical protein LMG23994_06325 [Cupriavidus pinatubonensis]